MNTKKQKELEWAREWEKEIRYQIQLEFDSNKGRFSETFIEAISEIIKSQIEKARKEGYKAGLNLWKEYNDPTLIKQIEKKVKDEILEEAISEINALSDSSCDKCAMKNKVMRKEVLRELEIIKTEVKLIE